MTTTGLRQFDQTFQETNTWLNEISEELGHPDRQMAYHALRGVLFALRDRLPVNDSFHLASQLPALVRGIYFESYSPAGKPEKYDIQAFYDRVMKELQAAGGANPDEAAHAVLRVLSNHISAGEANHIVNVLPKDLQRLWPAQG